MFRLAAAVSALEQKISSMKAGDVVTVGIRQNPGIIGRQTIEDVRSGRASGKGLLAASGMR